jgi:tRNA pseudouridine55 synthase
MHLDLNLEEGAIIPVDKPLGWTSADVVRKLKFLLQRVPGAPRNIKVGHAGTLDPLATGLLLICVGKATKQAERLQAGEKEYIAQIRVGATTPSFDLEQAVDRIYPFEHITRESAERALQRLTGTYAQAPPIFSAKLVDGQRAYTLAREGRAASLKPAEITVHKAALLHFALPDLTVEVACSKGTYIRALARDLGEALQSGGYLTGLQRTRSGNYHISSALSLEEVEKLLKSWKTEKNVISLQP